MNNLNRILHCSKLSTKNFSSLPSRTKLPDKVSRYKTSKQSAKYLPSRTWNVSRNVTDRIRQEVILKACTSATVIVTKAIWEETVLANRISNQLAMLVEDKKAQDDILDQCTDKEIVLLTKELTKLTNVKKQKMLLPLLENEVVKRIFKFSKDELLFIADAFYVLDYKPHKYLWALNKVFYMQWLDFHILPKDILQLLFYIGVHRISSVVLMNLIEEFLSKEEHFQTYTIHELGLICHGFFASNTSLKDIMLLDMIADKVLTGLSDKSFVRNTLSNILKVLRHSGYYKVSFYESLAKELCQHKGNWSFNMHVISHICKTYSSVKICSPELFKILSESSRRLISSGKTFREKDIANVIIAFASLNYDLPEDVINHAIQKWGNENLQLLHPELFVEFLTSLCVLKRYPHNLLNFALSPQFLKLKEGRPLEQYFQLLCLDTAAGVEVKGYSKCRLSKNYINNEPAGFVRSIEKELMTRQGLRSLVYTVQDLLDDPEKVDLKFIFKFSAIPDVEIWKNRKGVAQKIKRRHYTLGMNALNVPVDIFSSTSIIDELLQEKYQKDQADYSEHNRITILKAPDTGKEQKITIKMYGYHQYIKNKPQLIGLHQLELRLLQHLGYTVVMVPPALGKQLDSKTPKEKRQLVQEQILNPLGIT